MNPSSVPVERAFASAGRIFNKVHQNSFFHFLQNDNMSLTNFMNFSLKIQARAALKPKTVSNVVFLRLNKDFESWKIKNDDNSLSDEDNGEDNQEENQENQDMDLDD